MAAPALDAALGAEDAASQAVPRLGERLSTTWRALRAALAGGPAQAPLAAQQLAFLARYRLVAPPPADADAAALGAALPSLPPAAADAALLVLAVWARSAAGAANAATLRAIVAATVAHAAAAPAPRALLLAAAAAAPGCPPDAHDDAWTAALETLEQRQQDMRCATRRSGARGAWPDACFCASCSAAGHSAEGHAACGYLAFAARAPWAAQRAAAASVALAACCSAGKGETAAHAEHLRRALLCFQAWDALCAAVPRAGAPEPAAAALAAADAALRGAEAPLWCAGALCAAGALLGLLRRGAAVSPEAAQAREGLLAAFRDAAAAAAAESVAARGACDIAAHAAAGRRARAVACAAARLARDGGSVAAAAVASADVTACVAVALLAPGGAALGPLQALAAAAASGAPPAAAAAAARRMLSAPPADEAGAHARLLCEAFACGDPAAPMPALQAAVFDELCAACAAAYAAARTHALHAASQPPPPPAEAAESERTRRACLDLAFLCPATVLAAAGPAVLSDGAAGGARPGVALAALSHVEFARPPPPAPPPPGFAALLEGAARSLGAGGGAAASALATALPRDDELDAPAGVSPPQPAWRADAATSARCHFLLRALPFALAPLEAASGALQPGPPPPQLCDAPLPRGPLFDAAAPLALRCVGHPAPAAAEAAHMLLQATLRGRHPARGVLAPAYIRAAVDAFPGPGAPDVSAAAAAAAASLRALPPADRLAVPMLRIVADRAAALQAVDPAAASEMRAVLFGCLLHVHFDLLPEAFDVVEAEVRALRGAAARQGAIDQLCALLAAGTDHYRKRPCVDWCLRLAASLRAEEQAAQRRR